MVLLFLQHINSKSSSDCLKHLLPPDINLGVKRRKLCDPCEERQAEDPKGAPISDGESTLYVDGNCVYCRVQCLTHVFSSD